MLGINCLRCVAEVAQLFLAPCSPGHGSAYSPIEYRPKICFRACVTVAETVCSRLRLKCDGTRAETRFRLSAKRTSPFKSAGASVQWTAGSRGVRISVSNAGYTMFRGSVRGTGYPLHSPVSPSLSLPCVTVCHHFLTGVYRIKRLNFSTTRLSAKKVPL